MTSSSAPADAATFSGTVGFLGTGKMATALAKGLVAAGFVRPGQVLGSDVSADARAAFAEATGGRADGANAAVLAAADVVVLAVKPQQMADLLREIGRPGGKTLFVSVAAGVGLPAYVVALGPDARIVRVMPNTPCLVGAGASGYSVGGAATEADGELVRTMLETVGVAVRVPEHLLDAVTGLSGSGPAYVYVMIEALADGGVRAGLPRDVAQALAAQTVLGAAKMVLETGQHPGALKDAVASPGGTTIAGLHALERAGVRAALMDAVEAATKRATELGKKE